ncbi:MAG: hypothetical protein SFZ23_05120 [Planctomycetota bacterium]|nr:hypothetical protein [Planctomycetota bacterium]
MKRWKLGTVATVALGAMVVLGLGADVARAGSLEPGIGQVTVLAQSSNQQSSRGLSARSTARLVKFGVGVVVVIGIGVARALKRGE